MLNRIWIRFIGFLMVKKMFGLRFILKMLRQSLTFRGLSSTGSVLHGMRTSDTRKTDGVIGHFVGIDGIELKKVKERSTKKTLTVYF